jgi:7-cyano-7-deazaguanine reductase
MIAEAAQEQLQRLRLDDRLAGQIVDDEVRIGGYWYPRGGIPIDVFWQSSAPPADLWLPDQGVMSRNYRDT